MDSLRRSGFGVTSTFTLAPQSAEFGEIPNSVKPPRDIKSPDAKMKTRNHHARETNANMAAKDKHRRLGPLNLLDSRGRLSIFLSLSLSLPLSLTAPLFLSLLFDLSLSLALSLSRFPGKPPSYHLKVDCAVTIKHVCRKSFTERRVTTYYIYLCLVIYC